MQSASNKQTKCSTLRALLQSPQTEFIMEAHNGLSAKIVEEAGFPGIWASGFTLSAQFGLRDANEASSTQVLEMLDFMSEAVRIPILFDGDSGYGNFNKVRRLVRMLERREIAGICIEDKLFPKTNSFIDSEQQPLADVDEFCGKIMAAKDSQTCSDFCVVARVEALIAGWGMEEALRRAEAYTQAGADAILVHSKRTDPSEIVVFAGKWGGRLPLVIVPTMYCQTPTDVFRNVGVSLVIWANHMLRASVAAMTDVSRIVAQSQSISEIEDRVAPLPEIFRLQHVDELREAERRYGAPRKGLTSST